MTMTTMKVSVETRDRVKALGAEQHKTAEEVITAALDEAERQARRDRMRARSLELLDDPDELAEIKSIHEDMEHLRAW